MLRPLAIIIPCRNEERYLARCLDSVLANDYDRRLLDIVVVDGMSTDRTREIVADYSRRFPFIRLIDNPDQLKPHALNRGIAQTTAEIVMRIDAHAVYAPDYLSTLVNGLETFQADNIGGIRETDLGESGWSQAVGTVISHPFAAGNALYRTGVSSNQPRRVDTVFCGCYRRSVFERIGVFNERLIRAQDREFNERLRARGGKIVLDPSVRCTYFPRTGFWNYCRWNAAGAYWLFSSRRFTRTRMTSWRNWIPALFVLWHVVALAAQLGGSPLAPMLWFPIALYWALNLFVSGRAAKQLGNWPLLPAFLLLFGATHYSYGLGSIVGWIHSTWGKRALADCSPQRLKDYGRAAA